MTNRLAPLSDQGAKVRASLAAVSRYHPDRADEIAELTRRLKFHRVHDFLTLALKDEPHLSAEERAALGRLIAAAPYG